MRRLFLMAALAALAGMASAETSGKNARQDYADYLDAVATQVAGCEKGTDLLNILPGIEAKMKSLAKPLGYDVVPFSHEARVVQRGTNTITTTFLILHAWDGKTAQFVLTSVNEQRKATGTWRSTDSTGERCLKRISTNLAAWKAKVLADAPKAAE